MLDFLPVRLPLSGRWFEGLKFERIDLMLFFPLKEEGKLVCLSRLSRSWKPILWFGKEKTSLKKGNKAVDLEIDLLYLDELSLRCGEGLALNIGIYLVSVKYSFKISLRPLELPISLMYSKFLPETMLENLDGNCSPALRFIIPLLLIISKA